jgi:hypothetical protein
LDWNPQGARRRGRPKQTWKETVLEEAGKCDKTWSEVKKLAANRVRWICFTSHMPYFLMERKDIAAATTTTDNTTTTTVIPCIVR